MPCVKTQISVLVFWDEGAVVHHCYAHAELRDFFAAQLEIGPRPGSAAGAGGALDHRWRLHGQHAGNLEEHPRHQVYFGKGSRSFRRGQQGNPTRHGRVGHLVECG